MQRLLLFLYCALLLGACQKEATSNNELDQLSTHAHLSEAAGCAIGFSYDMLTATYVMAGEQDAELTLAEQALRVPTYVHCNVKACINDDGTLSAEVEMLPLPVEFELPANIIGNRPLVDPMQMPHRMRIDHDAITFYDEDKQVQHSDVLESNSASFLQQIMAQANHLEQAKPVSAQNTELLFEAFTKLGYEVRNEAADRFGVLVQSHDDGSRSEVVLDKKVGMWRGQADFGADGQVRSKVVIHASDNTGDVTLPTGHTFSTYFDSPSGDYRLQIRSESRLDNFTWY